MPSNDDHNNHVIRFRTCRKDALLLCVCTQFRYFLKCNYCVGCLSDREKGISIIVFMMRITYLSNYDCKYEIYFTDEFNVFALHQRNEESIMGGGRASV